MSGYFLRLLARAAAAPELGRPEIHEEVAEPLVATGEVSRFPNRVTIAPDASAPDRAPKAAMEQPRQLQAAVAAIAEHAHPSVDGPTHVDRLSGTAQRQEPAAPQEPAHLRSAVANRSEQLVASSRPPQPPPEAAPPAVRVEASAPVTDLPRSATFDAIVPSPRPEPVRTPARAVPPPAASQPTAALPLPTREPEPEAAPAVHITIGRIEVTAAPPAAPAPAPREPSPAHRPQSLDAYLAQRARAR